MPDVKRYSVSLKFHVKEIGSYSPALLSLDVEETVPEDVDPVEYMIQRLQEGLTRKTKVEKHFLKCLSATKVEEA